MTSFTELTGKDVQERDMARMPEADSDQGRGNSGRVNSKTVGSSTQLHWQLESFYT